MFDLWIDKARQKMFAKLESELDEKEADGKPDKFLSFMVRVMPKIVASILVFLGFLYIFNKIYDKFGIDRIIIVYGLIIILVLRGISKTLNQASK